MTNTPTADGVLTTFSFWVGSATIMNLSHVKSELTSVAFMGNGRQIYWEFTRKLLGKKSAAALI